MSNGTKVKKRDGRIEALDLEKMHLMVEEACRGLTGVSASQVEMTSGIQFYDGISTAEIQEILIKSAADLISLDSPNYQFVASRLLLFSIRKQIYGGRIEMPPLEEHINKCVSLGVYDSEIYNHYSKEDIDKANSFIEHERDYLFTYAGLRQVVDKYLVQDRGDKTLYETPQFMYMMISLTGFAKYPKEIRMNYVKRYYDAISKHKINIPTPIMAGVRTPLRQYASCTLLDCGDSLESIIATDSSMMRYIAGRAGIGLNVGRLRAIGSKIRNGEVISTGLIPFLKKFQSSLESCHQGGIRKASMTCYVPIWHLEIEDVIVLKNNKGNDENRVRNIDYGIVFSRLFYERFLKKETFTLFSPNDVPGLYDAFGTDKFDELYVKYENAPNIRKKVVDAQELFIAFLNERKDTGRYYPINIDHMNSHSSFKDKVEMSNLCVEITLPTYPLEHIDDENGEIALCILSSINVGVVKNDKELENLCDLSVRFLDELIDHQSYPVKAAEISTKARRSLGIGVQGLAHYLAKLGLNYEQKEAWSAVHGLSESLQYYLLKSSNELAKEKGYCEYFGRTKYSDGILPIDTYKKDVDEICNDALQHDWEELRQNILKYGLRHSTLTAQMPGESSSLSINATNSIEPPRGYMSIKRRIKQIVPQYSSLKNQYTLLWDMKSNEGYLNIVAVMQKFFDQSISANWSYNPEHYEDNKVPMSVIMNDMLMSFKKGLKTSYYLNTYDGKKDDLDLENLINSILEEEDDCDACK
jgi:ribonucleoside-diphosphate reductase alpha chain